MTTQTVYVVDDDDSVRRSMTWLLESVGHVVCTYASGAELLCAYESGWQGCIVLDVRMPGASGLEVQRQLISRDIPLPVIMVTGHADVPMAVQAMKAGAFDFIEKPFNDQLLLDRIAAAMQEERTRREARMERDGAQRRLARLTPRELEVMHAVIAGDANKRIAQVLGVSIKTVESHRARVMHKLEVASVPELVNLALRAQGKP